MTYGGRRPRSPYAQAVGQRILVVDDDPTVSDVVRRYLEHAGLTVTLAADGPAALASFDRERPDLVVLDLMLPGIDGLEVCRRLRAQAGAVPIVMLTARGDEADRVLGLQLGADDYVTKPFSPRQLTKRVQSVLRRAAAPPPWAAGGASREGGEAALGGGTGLGSGGAEPGEAVLTDGDLVLDQARRVATLGRVELALT